MAEIDEIQSIGRTSVGGGTSGSLPDFESARSRNFGVVTDGRELVEEEALKEGEEADADGGADFRSTVSIEAARAT